MKNRQALSLLFTANAISGFAQGLSMLAIPWYFARQSESSLFNLIFAAITFANLFWGLLAGTLVDRFPRKNVFLLTNVVEGLVVLSVALLGWRLGSLSDILIVVVLGITMLGYRMHYPNLYAFVHEITEPKDYTRVTSYIEIVGQATNVIAGALAVLLLEGLHYQGTFGVLGELSIHIDPWSIYEIFTLDGITYFISVAIISLIKYVPDKNLEVELGSLFGRLQTGFIFLKNNINIFIFGFFSHSIFVIMLVSLFAVMPMYIQNYLESGGHIFGTMEVLYGLGALSAGLFIGRLTRNKSTVSTIILFMFLTGIVLAFCVFIKSIPFFFFVGLVIGFSNAGTRILRVSYLFNHIPNNIIGRVNSVFSLLNILIRAFFVLLFSISFFARDTNIVYAYGIMSLFAFLSGIVLLLNYSKFKNG